MSESIEAEKSAPLDLIREKAGIELTQAQRTCWREVPWRPSTRMFDADRATEASKKFVLTLFDHRAAGVFRRESDYEIFKSELDATAANVVAELQQAWSTFSPGGLDEAHVGLTMTCIPAVRRALAENQETWKLRFLDTRIKRMDAEPSANAQSRECERITLSDLSRSPAKELWALGLTGPIGEETAGKLWAALLRIDADVRKAGPSDSITPVRAAYQAIASHIVGADTPDQVLEEMIPQAIFSFASTRPWSRYGKLEYLCHVLDGCVIEWRAARLEMASSRPKLDTGPRPRNAAGQNPSDGETLKATADRAPADTRANLSPLSDFLYERLPPEDANHELLKRLDLKGWGDSFDLLRRGYAGEASLKDFIDGCVTTFADGVEVHVGLKDETPISERCREVGRMAQESVRIVSAALEPESDRLGNDAVSAALEEFSRRVGELSASAKTRILRGELARDTGAAPSAPASQKRRGRQSIFTPELLKRAREMKEAKKTNVEIARLLYRTLTPTPDQRRSVPTILKHHFGSKKNPPRVE